MIVIINNIIIIDNNNNKNNEFICNRNPVFIAEKKATAISVVKYNYAFRSLELDIMQNNCVLPIKICFDLFYK